MINYKGVELEPVDMNDDRGHILGYKIQLRDKEYWAVDLEENYNKEACVKSCELRIDKELDEVI
jgi:hypothetical protein